MVLSGRRRGLMRLNQFRCCRSPPISRRLRTAGKVVLDLALPHPFSPSGWASPASLALSQSSRNGLNSTALVPCCFWETARRTSET
jgi:hypothetical protein